MNVIYRFVVQENFLQNYYRCFEIRKKVRFWEVAALRGPWASLGQLPSKKVSKNLDFNLLGKKLDFPKLHFFRILEHCATDLFCEQPSYVRLLLLLLHVIIGQITHPFPDYLDNIIFQNCMSTIPKTGHYLFDGIQT